MFRIINLSVGIILFGQTASSLGVSATVVVGSGGFKFVPATTDIPVNGSVIWSWAGSGHSATSGTPTGTPGKLWTSIETNMAATNPTVFINPNASSASSYYRVLRLPHP